MNLIYKIMGFCLGITTANSVPHGVMVPNAANITSEMFDDFKLFAEYSAAAYCGKNTNSYPYFGDIICKSKNCPTVQTSGAKTILQFDKTKGSGPDLRGFVSVDLINNLTVVSIRGTASFSNIMADFNFKKVEFEGLDNCTGCRIHKGFFKAHKERLKDVYPAVKKAKADYPYNRIIFTGHSLGGAIATTLGVWVREHKIPEAEIWSFGSPRIGNEAFANFVTRQRGITYRVTHLNDPIPRVGPSFKPFQFQHIGPEMWLGPSGTPTTDNYTIHDITICNGVENKSCNAGVPKSHLDVFFHAHKHYLGPITICTTENKKREDRSVRMFEDNREIKALLEAETEFAMGRLTEREAFMMANKTLRLSDEKFIEMSDCSEGPFEAFNSSIR